MHMTHYTQPEYFRSHAMNPTIRLLIMLCLTLPSAMPGQARQPPQLNAHRSVDVFADDSGRLRPALSTRGIIADGALQYWADPTGNRILRADPGGLSPQEVASGLNTPYGLGFDAVTQSFIWTSSGDAVVQKLALASGAVSALNSSFDDPPAIEIEHEGGKQAITVVGSDVVRVTVDDISDETTTEVLLSLGGDEVIHGLALDTEAGQVFVGNAVGMMAYKIDLADQAISRLTFTDHVPPTPDLDEGELP
jgi:hypothetical protein